MILSVSVVTVFCSVSRVSSEIQHTCRCCIHSEAQIGCKSAFRTQTYARTLR